MKSNLILIFSFVAIILVIGCIKYNGQQTTQTTITTATTNITATSTTMATTTTIIEGKELTFNTISIRLYSGHDERKNYVITNYKDWKDLWDKVNSINIPQPPLLAIDFNQSIIIAVFQGQHSSGGDIEIIKVIETGNLLKVFVKESFCLATAAVTHSYHIIEIQRLDKQVEFITEQKSCL